MPVKRRDITRVRAHRPDNARFFYIELITNAYHFILVKLRGSVRSDSFKLAMTD